MNCLRLAHFVVFASVALGPITSRCLHADPVGGSQPRATQLTEVIQTGWLFVDGVYLRPPYRIEVSPDSVVVNGTPLPIDLADEAFAPERGLNRLKRGPFRNRGRRLGLVSAGPARHHARQTTAERFALTLTTSLRTDGAVILFQGAPYVDLHSPSEQFTFCETMLAAQPTRDQIDAFARLPEAESERTAWQQWLAEFTPAVDLRTRMQALVTDTLARDAEQSKQIIATQRLDRFAYPLTLVAMMLGVIGFGHLLQWVGRGLADQSEAGASTGAKYAATALLLMLGMSAIDLIWTVLAVQAGAMSEVNPIAAPFADSPARLALFKLAVTGTALAILYVWRSRPSTQQATWWMCLVCVLLTFRWVMFDSMIQ